jgi:hypothetical protein
MSSFIELVILPAFIPWLIVLVTSHLETRLDRLEQDGEQRGPDHSIVNGNSA